MKIFGGDRITNLYNKLGASEDLPIEVKMVSKGVERAQKKVEGRNFSIRKNVLKYDDVMNAQREVIYKQRRQVLDGENLKQSILNMFNSVIEAVVLTHTQLAEGEKLNTEGLLQDIQTTFGITDIENVKENEVDSDKLIEELKEKVLKNYEAKEAEFGEKELRELERVVVLKVVDQKWMDHIDNMDELKNGIGLRAYAQKDPVVQYRIEGTEMFEEMNEDIKLDVVKILSNVQRAGDMKRTEAAKITATGLQDTAINLVDGKYSEKEGGMNKTVVNEGPKVGRNDPCPCGSGKKYKNCCGK